MIDKILLITDNYLDRLHDTYTEIVSEYFTKKNRKNNKTLSPKKTNTVEIETSLTLDYRKNKWGMERIVLDTVSNHLPADSQGTIISVEYLQDGQWIDFRDADKIKTVETIRIKDNGKGFSHKLLDVLYSTKTHDNTSVGQFGEGMKLVAAASLRNGLDMEYRSRDWLAKPYAKNEIIDTNELE